MFEVYLIQQKGVRKMKSHDLRYEFYIGGSPEQVWSAIVSPEVTKKIYLGSIIESTFQVGDSIKYVGPGLDGDQTVHIYGNVLAFETNQTLSYTQRVGDAYNGNDHSYESRITFHLEAVGSCTKLTLVHDQWSEGDPSYDNSRISWWVILSNTKTLIETGKTLEMGKSNWHDDLTI